MRTPNFRSSVARVVPFAILSLTLAITSPVHAQSARELASQRWTPGELRAISELPPGQFRRSLEGLSPLARTRALRWLQEIGFTGADLNVLRVDRSGGVYFEDVLVPDSTLPEEGPNPTAAADVPGTTLTDAFRLHSRPGAPNVVYLDFTGHVFSATAWGSGSFSAVPYDLDGNSATFNDTERVRIVDIWHRVAEDLAPFDIDVTTEEPASFNRYTGRVLITRDVDANGTNMPSKGAGGVAYVNVFGISNYHTYYSPALVYYNNLGAGVETYVAEASSHEFGHNLGLSHDGTQSGTTYYAGHGSGLVSWAPIMGNSYYNNVTEWSRGEYPDANQTQDDIAIIQGKLGARPDDHGNASGTATLLVTGASGSVLSSNPEMDPANLLPENKGVINSAQDVDAFRISTGSGPLSLSVRPAWDAFYRATSRRGANLDLRLELRDASGGLVASSDPAGDTSAAISVTVAAGVYTLLVSGEGTGSAATGYSDYASLGQYFINGSVTPAGGGGTPPSATFFAASETKVAGTVTGNHVRTQADDGLSESIKEVETKEKQKNLRTSWLEHRWNFNLSAKGSATVFANAWSGGSGDGDTFRFEYSVDGGATWNALFTVSSTAAANRQSQAISSAPAGTIIIRVTDTNRAAGKRELNTVQVDHLYLQQP